MRSKCCVGTAKTLSVRANFTQPICAGTTPGDITGTTPTIIPSGTPMYSWEMSTTSSVAGFAVIPGATGINYTPGTISQTTWYRRKVTSGTLTSYSPVLQVTVIAAPTTYTITPAGSYCSGGATILGLSGSQTGVKYQLKLGTTSVGSPVSGTGAAINFGSQSAAGTYTVTADKRITLFGYQLQYEWICCNQFLPFNFCNNLPGRSIGDSGTITVNGNGGPAPLFTALIRVLTSRKCVYRPGRWKLRGGGKEQYRVYCFHFGNGKSGKLVNRGRNSGRHQYLDRSHVQKE